MALAPFFDKSRLAASAVLQGFDASRFTATLESVRVALAFDKNATETAEGRSLTELSMSLLARLYPRITLLALDGESQDRAGELTVLAEAINPEIEIERCQASDLAEAGLCLVVGETALHREAPTLYLGSDGWVAGLSVHEPVGCRASPNPFGAGAAACLGAANLFRAVFMAQLPGDGLDEELRLSILNLESGSEAANPAWQPVDIGKAHLVGAGAIGNGCVWALIRAKHLSGELHVIDGETLTLDNLQRYVLALHTDVERHKTDIAEARAKELTADLSLHGHSRHWGQHLAAQGSFPTLHTVAVAVDTALDRRAIQAALPKWIVNSWTQIGDLGVSRHAFLGDNACLCCLYLQEEEALHEDQLVARAIGLPDQYKRVRELLHTGDPVGEELLGEITAALGIDAGALSSFAARPLREFYSDAVCGGHIMRLGGSTTDAQDAYVPMAFQSALAGVLLAGQIVAQAGGLDLPSETKSIIDTTRPVGTHLQVPVAKHPSGRCLCQDQDFIGAYLDRHRGLGRG